MKSLNGENMSIKSLNEVDFDLQLLNLIREIHMVGRNDFIADLHTHTIFSDGFLSPKELIHKAIMDDIDIIAIMDHNSVKGVVKALKVVEKVRESLQKKIYVIPGIEFSTAIDDKRIHIVGLFVNIYSPYLLNCIEKIKIGHFERAKIQLEKLKKIGVYIGFDEYKQIVGDRCPNWKTMSEAIVRHGYASDIEEARRLYTKKGKPAHVSYTEKWHKITPTSAITAIKKAGGLAFIAHLGDIEKEFGVREMNLQQGIEGQTFKIHFRKVLHATADNKRACRKTHRMSLWTRFRVS